MARPEKPVDPAAPYAAFALHLRKQRADGGSPTYGSLARRTGYSVSALSQAAAGRKLPSLDLTLAFAGACGGERARWERLWKAARGQGDARGAADLPPEAGARPAEPPVPASAENARDFVICLRELKAWAGNPSLSRIEKATSGAVRRSTLSDALNPARRSLPSLRTMTGLVLMLLGTAHEQGRIKEDERRNALKQWQDHWCRLFLESRSAPPGPAMATSHPERVLRVVRVRRAARPAPAPKDNVEALRAAIASHKARLAELEAQLQKAEAARDLRLLDRRRSA
ncbi:hypothetical protein [Streptomyces sp. XH2]|uniref:hypothetical protein n=1 Tax=Streptomyces sp. XH2 TaxID=3412483 RepID=UPI003C7CD94A